MLRFPCFVIPCCLILSLVGVGGVLAEPSHSANLATTSAGEFTVRGLLLSKQRAVLSSEMNGKVNTIAVQTGEHFKKGDKLIGFSCGLQRARLAQAQAAHKGAGKTLGNRQRLQKLGSVSQLELDLAQVELAQAEAELTLRRIEVGYCTVRAPFGGRVVAVHVRPHESVTYNDELLEIVNNKELEVDLVAPSGWLRWLQSGTPLQMKVDEIGQTYAGEVVTVGGVVEPVSQTVRVRGRLLETPAELIAGMSGEVRLTPAP